MADFGSLIPPSWYESAEAMPPAQSQFPDAPPSRQDAAYQTSVDRWKQLAKDVFFSPVHAQKAFDENPTFMNFLGIAPMGGIGKVAPKPIVPGNTGIRAYHGSPYDFDKFDLSRIGTGEGAQAYGHGLYFAERPEVAQTYKFTTNNMPVGMNTVTARHAFRAMQDAAKEGLTGSDQISFARSRLNEQGRGAGNTLIQREYYDAANNLEQFVNGRQGKMYEVNINAKPEQFLDFDKPLGAQSPQIQNVAQQLIPRKQGYTPDLTGQETYSIIGQNRGELHQVDYPRGHWERTYNPEGATAALRDAGIPGIRYLDQGSRMPNRLGQPGRAIASPTSNYVLFRDDIVDILRKYGILGATTAGAADATFGNLTPAQQN